MSELKVLADNIMTIPEKGAYNTFTATITRINDNNPPFYAACPECSRKVCYVYPSSSPSVP